MKIYCARHGHAELAPNQQGDRELSEQGRREVTKVAGYLASRGVHATHVMHSEKCRTRQTAGILAQKIASETTPEESLLLSAEAEVAPLVHEVQQWNDNTLLVGHMPFVSFFVSALVMGKETVELVRFSPGTLVCLERQEGHRWIIDWILRPDLVPDDFCA